VTRASASRDRIFVALLLLFVTGGVRSTLASPSSWLLGDYGATAAGDGALHVISHDAVVATVSDADIAQHEVVALAMDSLHAIGYAGLGNSGGRDYPTVLLVDLITAHVIGSLQDNNDNNDVARLVLSPDATRLYATGLYLSYPLRSWDVASGAVTTLAGINGGIAISPDGGTLYGVGTSDISEQCDGGPNAGARCLTDSDCVSASCRLLCASGSLQGSPCAVDADCCTSPGCGDFCGARDTWATINRVDLSDPNAPTITGRAILPCVDYATSPPAHCANTGHYGFVLTPDGSTLFMNDANVRGVLALDTATFGASTISDRIGALTSDSLTTMALAGSSLYGVQGAYLSATGHVVVVDVATRAVTDRIPVDGATEALAASLDGTQVYAGYRGGGIDPAVGAGVAIIDTATNTVVGSVADPHGVIGYPRSVVDPYIPTSFAARNCDMSKRKAAGAASGAKLKCYAQAKLKAQPVASACLAAADGVLAGKFAKLGAACPGDLSVVAPLVDACVSAALADVPGDGTCQATSTKATGKAALKLLACGAKNLAKPGSLAKCRDVVDQKLAKALATAGGCAAGSTQTDEHAACLDAIVAALPMIIPSP
jgi:hypothetical protein